MTFTYLFSVRVKPIQKFIIKNEKNVARNIVASKKCCFLIFVRLDWVVLENFARMQNFDIKSRGIRDCDG